MPTGGLTPPPRPPIRRSALVAVAAGAVMIVGAVLPWLELSAAGEDVTAAADVGSTRPLLAGLVVIVCMLLSLAMDSVRIFVVPAIASLGSAASASIDYFRLRDAIADLPTGINGSIGFGIYLCIVASLVAAASSVAAALE